MFCTNCGKEIIDTAKFCNFCGSPVRNVIVRAPANSDVTSEPTQSVPVQDIPAQSVPEPEEIPMDNITDIAENVASEEFEAPVEEAASPETAENVSAPYPEVARYRETGVVPAPVVTPPAATPVATPPAVTIAEAPEPKPERKYTLGHIMLCLAAVAVMAIVAGVFAGLYFSVV